MVFNYELMTFPSFGNPWSGVNDSYKLPGTISSAQEVYIKEQIFFTSEEQLFFSQGKYLNIR